MDKLKLCLITVLNLSMAGCMLGPDFHSPRAPHPKRYTEAPLPRKTTATPSAGNSGKAQYFASGKNIPHDWWVLFHSSTLNKLVQQGIDHNPNLAAAYATLRQAQENLKAQVGTSFAPAIVAQTSGTRELFSNATFGLPGTNLFNLFNASVNVSYTLDIFGYQRRQVESLFAQVDYQQFQLIAAYLTLTSNIVTTSITVASYEEQLRATRNLLKTEENQLALLRKQFKYGGIPLTTVLTQQTLVNQTRANIPVLEKNLSINKHALSVLVGALPNAPLPHIKLNSLKLPPNLPVSLPSNLVRQRPDVRAAEATIHVASANIGVATANLFPQISLTGTYGWQALTPSTLFATKTNTWAYGATIAETLFQGGALLAKRRAAIAAYDQAFGQYKLTVLQAFQNVADSLRAIETDANLLYDYRSAELAAKNNLDLTIQQFHLGGVSYLSLLNAQQQYQQTLVSRIQAQAARYADTAALFQALGGGWWNKSWCVKECFTYE